MSDERTLQDLHRSETSDAEFLKSGGIMGENENVFSDPAVISYFYEKGVPGIKLHILEYVDILPDLEPPVHEAF
ncbi:MAG TPA: hypothetical protein P5244_01360 [Syntrophales bacterium]|nr:hypothetical protein [Syntrophales bacterium]